MGSRKGFLGESVRPFSIFVAITRRIRPAVVLHECTRSFRWQIFEANGDNSKKSFFPGYSIHHILTNPPDFGWPVQRSRSYTAIVKDSLEMVTPVDQIFRLFINPGPKLDASAFLVDDEEKAHWHEFIE